MAGLFVIARWSAAHAPEVRATDQFAYYALSAVNAHLATLFLPFSLVALGVVIRNRRRQRAMGALASGGRE
ncbi:hypothetical protein KMZ30_11955 [Phycicoccus sp. KQZ13P-1]|uniref:hypothetical protein n=1 Tax=Phycicoccus mangrovi TaxID=2840470 RepID=UPI001C002D44|nr:hypothetical protein [Phycicoccus mangrovi]MBT9256287.1 hypothetical protein [Phycicoccus mangrovi]